MTIRAFAAFAEERGDLDPQRRRWNGEGGVPSRLALPDNVPPPLGRMGTNRFGQNSWACRPGYASAGDGAGYLQSGVHLQIAMGSSGIYEMCCVTNSPSEGAHERTGYYMFKVPLTKEEAATITDVKLHLPATIAPGWAMQKSNSPGPIVYPTKDGRDVWAWHIFGIAEDNVRACREQDAYDLKYMSEWYYRIPYKAFAPYPKSHERGGLNARNYQPSMFFYEREHTQARVAWEWPHAPNSYTPTQGSAPFPPPNTDAYDFPGLTPIIQEIVGRPGWKPNNSLAIAIAPDGIWNDLALIPWDPTTFINGGSQLVWLLPPTPSLVITTV